VSSRPGENLEVGKTGSDAGAETGVEGQARERPGARSPALEEAVAAVTPVEPELEQTEAPEWARKYPPLFVFAIAVLLAVAVLPSALNLPQTNPQETLEYAPVPPEEDDDTPPDGNVSALGLGSSSGISGEGASGGDGAGGGPIDDETGAGRNPSTKRCVGNPPRQTEDPLAPPCVPYFEGNNFGATYQGVTRDEIRVLMYVDGGINYTGASDQANRTAPQDKYFDLGKAPDPNNPEHLVVKGFRGWQRYFNERFQTYGRRVHFYVYFAGRGAANPEGRRGNAADNFVQIKPFAVVSFATEGAEDDYLHAMAKKGVLNFGAFGLRTQAFYNAYPKLIWGYQPSIEQQSQTYSTYLCTKVVPHPVAIAGDVNGDGLPDNGKPRKIGMVHTSDSDWPGLVRLAELTKQKVKECGGQVVDSAVFAECCLAQDNGDTQGQQTAANQMAAFKNQGITTILWPGGANGSYVKAAAGISYFPEWIFAGDSQWDGRSTVFYSQSGPGLDKHAIAVTPNVFQPGLQQQRCYQAFREADPSMPDTDMAYICPDYENLFQLFTGIQVAGPKLGPTSMDKGFHSIPQKQSGEPTVPACFYLPGDYTCVKDAQALFWDQQGQAPAENRPGCWRAVQAGQRYLPGKWPAGNVNAQFDGNMPCTGYNQSTRFNLA
jgi:hypothetical protein